jgi:hypothetical protein
MGNFKNKLDNYQCVPRELIFDNRISDRARFLFVYMASKPYNWSFFMQPMAKELGYSSETLRKYINELINFRWLIKGRQSVNDSGAFGSVEYTLMEKLTDSENIGHPEIPTRKKPDTVKNRIGKNHTLIEIDYLKKDITIEEKEISDDFEYPKINFNELKTKTELKKDYRDTITSHAPIINLQNFLIEYKKETLWINTIIEKHKLKPEHFDIAIKDYSKSAISSGKDVNQTLSQWKNHANNWINYQIQKNNN